MSHDSSIASSTAVQLMQTKYSGRRAKVTLRRAPSGQGARKRTGLEDRSKNEQDQEQEQEQEHEQEWRTGVGGVAQGTSETSRGCAHRPFS